MSDLAQKKCIPCEVGGPALTRVEAEALLYQVPLWHLSDDAKKLSRSFTFADFKTALQFADSVGAIAEEEGHHPVMTVEWGKVTIVLWTHAVGGLSENDFILAAKVAMIPGSSNGESQDSPDGPVSIASGPGVQKI